MMNQQAGGIQRIAQAQTGDLSGVPDQQLVQMATQPDPKNPLPQLVALGEVQRRKQARVAQQAAQAQGNGQARTVAQQVLGGQAVPPPQPQPPQPLDMPMPQPPVQPMAAGGIVALNDGGLLARRGLIEYDKGAFYPPAMRDRVRPVDPANDWAQQLIDWGRGVPHSVSNWWQRQIAADPRYQATYSNEGRNSTPPDSGPVAAGPAPYGPSNNGEFPTSRMLLPQPTPPSGGAGARGITSIKLPGSDAPVTKNPYDTAPAYTSEEEREAIIHAKYEQLKREYGPDVAEEYLKQIKAERAGMDKKYGDLKNESLMRAGLAIMSGKSKHGLVNIGQGGIAALDAHQAQRDKLDAVARDLRRQEMEAAIAKQGRDRDIHRTAHAEGNAATERKDRARTDAIEAGKYGNDQTWRGAEYGLKREQVRADIMRAEAAMRSAAEHARGNNDARMFSAITAMQKEAQDYAMDVVGKPTGLEKPGEREYALQQAYRDRLLELQRQNPYYQKFLQTMSGGGGGAVNFRDLMGGAGGTPGFSRAPR